MQSARIAPLQPSSDIACAPPTYAQDLLTSIRRFYNNTYTDAEKQVRGCTAPCVLLYSLLKSFCAKGLVRAR